VQLVERRIETLRYIPAVPHIPRPPSFPHGLISFLWAIGLGAFIYFGLLAVAVSSATAFIFSALAAFGIFLFVLVYGEDTPPKRQAIRRR
jgi:drug/metabolite transporter (DMT)-like permease